ncbi:hypothetical protein HNO86_02775 [Pseudomonas sp. C1C7]|uniref:NEL-type E3 ubiquitin ligase domain-containing protein n=1 Tax=Pseudomonas sp. C1C7 TaxID=2735272 RepID=UPI0015868169|nr:DUF6543 domain-containing protein [Pseudomonas sp. C1C7]NUT73962.1 hypothetical protein [Pseudomonas sp. C1C7]
MTNNPQLPSKPEGAFNSDLRGVHYDFLKDRIPAWFSQASTQRQAELGSHEMQLPAWYRTATPEQKTALGEQHTRFRETLNQIDARLGRIQDVFEFAEPLLKAAIKERFKQDLDVRNVFLARKYAPKSRDDLYGFLVLDQQLDQSLNVEYRGISLLEAALANFTPDEEQPLRCNDCQIITDWDSYDGDVIPTFESLRSNARPIAPHDFARLCRTLDLGKKYQAHIEEIVQPKDTTARESLEQQLQEHHRQQLAMATELASQQFATKAGSKVESGISADMSQMLKQLIASGSGGTLDGKQVKFEALKVFGIELVGPLLIGPDRESSDRVERLAVYLPNDPQQPLKEYASSADFVADLVARLHKGDYRRFFSRFIPMRQQGVFFSQFNTLYQPSGLTPQSDYPLQSKPVNLPVGGASIEGDLWQQLRQRAVAKLYADARAIAVPTEDEDRDARTARLESYMDAVTNVFNLAAFVVPGLGPIMLTVGAAQMCDDAFEGIEAYERGEPKEMWAHFSSVALNVAFVGGGAGILPQIHVSSVVDKLKPVTLADGKQKLWKPDLEPYKASVTLPSQATPNELGLHAHEGKTVLPLQKDHYLVQQDPVSEQYRIQHPTRPGAYSPELAHNGEGAWRHELERPLSWSNTTLMRRLGPMVEGLSDTELERIRQVSGVENDVLRRLHVESEPVPAILLDTIRRFRAHADAAKVAQGIGEGSLPSALCGFAASLAVELPGWPADKAIEAFSGDRLNGPSVKYGNPEASPQNTLKVTRSDLMNGRLPERIVDSLNEAQIKSLLPHYTPRTPEEQITALQKKLQAQAISGRARIMRSLYAERQPPANAAVAVVQRDFGSLPASMIEELLADATPAELVTLNTDKRVPLRLAEGARRLQQQMRLTRAYEGVYLDGMTDRDTEILILNTLKNVPGWMDDTRLEIREGGIDGELRASVGADDPGERKVLLRMNDGRYETRNARDEHLHGADDLYCAIQHALPDKQREAIGLPHVGQGAQLRAKIIEHQLTRDQLRPLLKMQPRLQPFFRVPERLSGERIGYPLSDHPDVSKWSPSFEQRFRELYPTATQEQMDAGIASWGASRETHLRNREREYASLKRTLHNWSNTQLLGVSEEERLTPAFRQRRSARLAIIKALDDAWRYTGKVDLNNTGRRQGQFIDLSDTPLHGQLAELPALSANFNHVSYVNLSGTGIVEADGFLKNFKRLRKLNLSDNELKKIPEPLGRMVHMIDLDLSDNLIEFDEPAVDQLSELTQLEYLALEGNPLKLPPDIGFMPNLQFVLLADTEINTWPEGLFEQTRGRTMHLDMRGNTLEIVPEAELGSKEAEVLARTLISQGSESISPENLRRIRDYRQSVGFESDRPSPPQGVFDSQLWKTGLTETQWKEKQDAWADLEREPGSEPFFNELRKLDQSADSESSDEAARIELCGKVWSMVEAAVASTALREKLFRMAAAPTTCVDAGAQLFNAMGVEVLISQAYDLGAEEMETRLVTLARGKSRLDELGKVARERISELLAQGHQFTELDEDGYLVTHVDAQGQTLEDIDEVEIHMVYPTQLAQRLELPWQSRDMMFRANGVTDEMITSAYERVLEKEKGPLLQERLIEQPFWVEYLKRQHSQAFTALRARGEPLLDLQAAQQAWLDSESSVQKIHWRSEVVRLAKLLGKPDSEVKPGVVMSDAQYFAEMEAIAAQEKALIAKLTGEALQRANL